MEDRKIGYELHIVANKIKRKMDAAALEYNITHTQFHILKFIATSKSNIYQKDIENSFNLRRSTVSKTLSLLEKKGLITKESVEEDARLKKISATDLGYEKIASVRKTFKEIDAYFTKTIGEEDMSVFYKVLDKLSELAD